MQPVYFLPNTNSAVLANQGGRLDRSILEARGISDVFADVTGDGDCGIADVIGAGPGGMSGCVLFYKQPNGVIPLRTGYYPADQTWHKIGDGSLVWIGVENSSPPTAKDFARKEQHGGYIVTLADGAGWSIPVIRYYDSTTSMPTELYWDESGALQMPIMSAYRQLWEHSSETVEWFYNGGLERGIDLSRALQLAVEAVCVNYRYGRNEQNIFRAINGYNYLGILGSTVDWKRTSEVIEAAKKNE